MTGKSPIDLGLPHRAPFLFLDEVLELEPGKSGVARKCFPASDPVFKGHFPGEPIVPGVLLGEAIAQLAGIVAAAEQPGRRFYLTAIRQMKFPSAALPEQDILITVALSGSMGGLVQAEGVASIEKHGESSTEKTIVAMGTIVLSSEK